MWRFFRWDRLNRVLYDKDPYIVKDPMSQLLPLILLSSTSKVDF